MLILKKNFGKRFVMLMLVIAIIFSLQMPLFAAEPTGSNPTNLMDAKNFYVDVWPEYDDPRVLVIYKGMFVNNTGQTIKKGEKIYFNIPTGAEIGMACETDANYGAHACQPYETKDVKSADGKTVDYVILSWSITKDIDAGQEYPVFLEFYYNPIEGETDKVINYEFRPSANIQSLNLLLQQPLRTSNFKLAPEAPTSGKSGDFTNYYYSYSNVTPQDKYDINISYTKTDKKPSVEKQETQTASSDAGGEGAKLGTSAWSEPGVIIAGGFFVLLLGFFVYYGINTSKKPNVRAQRIKNKEIRDIGSKSIKSSSKSNNDPSKKLMQEKKKIRQMLLNGEISEDTYRELMADLEE